MHGTGPGIDECEPPEVERVHAVDVLVGVDLHERGVVVDLRRRGVLHEERVDARVVVHLADRRDDVGLRRVLRQVDVRRRPAELLGLLHLHADVAFARAVVADEHSSESGRVPGRQQLVDARREVGEHRVGHRCPGIITALGRSLPLAPALNGGSASRR